MGRDKEIIEAILFSSDKPVTLQQIKEVIEDLSINEIQSLLEDLKKDYLQNRGLKIIEIAGGYQMTTDPEFFSYLKKFYQKKDAHSLTVASLETLAIIAYKQPTTRLEIESIRGVNVEGVLKSLLEKNLIRIVGRKNTLGRPYLFGTTKLFLEHFGLNSIEDLPKIEEFSQELATSSLLTKGENQQNERP